MKTLKEKAKELVDRFLKLMPSTDDIGFGQIEVAKQCALICVDEMQEHAQMIETPYEGYSNPYEYLKRVKDEINKL